MQTFCSLCQCSVVTGTRQGLLDRNWMCILVSLRDRRDVSFGPVGETWLCPDHHIHGTFEVTVTTEHHDMAETPICRKHQKGTIF